MDLLAKATRNLFFTGKGGVGKTSTSCAVAVALADAGKSVLLVSTDPASNLDEVFGLSLANGPVAIPGVARLAAMNVDPEAAAAAYKERVVGPYRNLLPADAVASIEEQLAGACTVEIAAFDEFAKLIGDASMTAKYDHIVFDTAPTGHTLRLLSLPAAWTGFIGKSAAGTSCLGPLQGLVAQRELYANAVATLSDAKATTVVLVSRPEHAAFEEAARTSRELAEIGVRNQALVLNGVFQPRGAGDPVAAAMHRIGNKAIASMPATLAALDRHVVALKPRQVVGVESLRGFFAPDDGAVPSIPAAAARPDLPSLEALVDELVPLGHGVVMTMGKGGVGKTTIAAAVAVALARRGHAVTLSTTDPAAHVANAIEGQIPGLTVTRIDPAREVAEYAAEVLAKAGDHLDAGGRALLEEDLRSPCTEEIAVFRAFARTVEQGREQFVVLDTAPTGHTILLLDAAEAYHREVMRTRGDMPDAVRRLLPSLRDPDYTRVLIVTVPEATPVHEAARLQADLERAGIAPFAWIINQSLRASGTRDPLLAERGVREAPFIDEVANGLASRAILIPWLPEVRAETVTPALAGSFAA